MEDEEKILTKFWKRKLPFTKSNIVRLCGTKGRLDTEDNKICEIEDRATEVIQIEKQQRDNLGNKKSFKRHPVCVTRDSGRSLEDVKRNAFFPNLTTIKHTIQKVQQGWAQEAWRKWKLHHNKMAGNQWQKEILEVLRGLKTLRQRNKTKDYDEFLWIRHNLWRTEGESRSARIRTTTKMTS